MDRREQGGSEAPKRAAALEPGQPSSADRMGGIATDGAAATDRVSALEARVEELGAALVRLDARLRAVEGEAAPLVAPVAQDRRDVPTEEPRAPEAADRAMPVITTPVHTEEGPVLLGERLIAVASVIGRTILILGGAFFLRALTESGVLSIGIGVPLALAYAAIWLAMGYRAAARAPTWGASFYGLAFVLIAYPMLAETTTLWHLLTPQQSALALTVATGLGLWTAWRRRLRPLMLLLLAAGTITAAAALIGTRTASPFMLYFIALGVAVEWLSADRDWPYARAGAAVVADLTMLAYTAVVLIVSDGYQLITTLIPLTLFVAFMASYVLRSQFRRRSLDLFERLQSSAVLLVGLVGAVVVTRSSAPPMIALPLGLACVLLGLVGYGAAYFLFVLPAKNPVDAWFNTSYALVGVVVGSWLVLGEPAYAWMALGALLTALGGRDQQGALPLHGSVCALLGALGSGLVWQVWSAFTAGAAASWPPLGIGALASLGVAALAYLAPLRPEARALLSSRIAKTLALALLVAGLGGVILAVTVGTLAGGVGEQADAGRIATLRTAVLAGSTLILAAVSRTVRFREAELLVYPILVAGGIKLALEDFLQGRAVTLTVGFLLYGIALIVAPRLKHRARP